MEQSLHYLLMADHSLLRKRFFAEIQPLGLTPGQPKVLGVRSILNEWIAFRAECVRRRTYYDLKGKEKHLHLLQGLKAILLDIDKAIEIVRNTAEESEVVPNLMIGFGIDEVQAEYVAEIKLRHLNREYILKRTEEIEELEDAIADLQDILKRPARINRIIMQELGDVAKKYGPAAARSCTKSPPTPPTSRTSRCRTTPCICSLHGMATLKRSPRKACA